MNHAQIDLGRRNRAAVRALFAACLGITGKEIATRLGISITAVSRHVRAIRAEWGS